MVSLLFFSIQKGEIRRHFPKIFLRIFIFSGIRLGFNELMTRKTFPKLPFVYSSRWIGSSEQKHAQKSSRTNSRIWLIGLTRVSYLRMTQKSAPFYLWWPQKVKTSFPYETHLTHLTKSSSLHSVLTGGSQSMTLYN